jgi:hypothetical protein
MTLSIKPVKKPATGRGNRFCGPAAISIITGLDTAQSAALIRQGTNKRSVQGTSIYEVSRALNDLGYGVNSVAKVNPLAPRTNPTLAAWLRDTTKTRGSHVYLISAGNHWQVVQGRRFCCGQTGEIVSIRDDKVKRRARVRGVWRIEPQFEPGTMRAEAKRVTAGLGAKPQRKGETNARTKARRLATKHGIEIERFSDGAMNVWAPEALDVEGVDPYWGDHFANDWAEALERVETYARLLA